MRVRSIHEKDSDDVSSISEGPFRPNDRRGQERHTLKVETVYISIVVQHEMYVVRGSFHGGIRDDVVQVDKFFHTSCDRLAGITLKIRFDGQCAAAFNECQNQCARLKVPGRLPIQVVIWVL